MKIKIIIIFYFLSYFHKLNNKRPKIFVEKKNNIFNLNINIINNIENS